jgi:hypothetical protein
MDDEVLAIYMQRQKQKQSADIELLLVTGLLLGHENLKCVIIHKPLMYSMNEYLVNHLTFV